MTLSDFDLYPGPTSMWDRLPYLRRTLLLRNVTCRCVWSIGEACQNAQGFEDLCKSLGSKRLTPFLLHSYHHVLRNAIDLPSSCSASDQSGTSIAGVRNTFKIAELHQHIDDFFHGRLGDSDQLS